MARAFIVLFFLGAIGAIAWLVADAYGVLPERWPWERRRRPRPVVEAAPPAAPEPPPEEREPPLAASLEKHDRRHVAPDAVRLVGGVEDPAGKAVPWRVLYVVGDVDGVRQPLERAARHRGRRFEVEFGFLGSRVPWMIDFGVLAPGYLRRVRSLEVEPGHEYKVDLTLERGEPVTGTVVDRSGRPVEWLEVLAVPMAGTAPDMVTGPDLDMQKLLLARPVAHFGDTTTDRHGRFEVRGLGPGIYGLLTTSDAYVLEHDRPLRPGDRDVRVVAVRAHALVGEIHDARTGKPVRAATLTLVTRTPGGVTRERTADVNHGKLWVVWKPTPAEAEEGFEAQLSVAAEGYHTSRTRLSYPRGKRHEKCRLGLDPIDVSSLASAHLEVVDTRQQPVETALEIRLADVRDHGVRPAATLVELEGRGRFRVFAPPGTWHLEVFPTHGLAPLWSGQMTLDHAREESYRCVLPPFGLLTLRRAAAPGAARPCLVTLESADGPAAAYRLEGREMQLALPPGAWKVSVSGRPERSSRTVTVREGEETVAVVDP